MSNNMVVGRIQSSVTPPITGGIYEALMEKAQRERDEAQAENKRLEVFSANIQAELIEARKENQEQARLLGSGGSREARLATERDHYKTSMETLLKSINDWNGSMVKEPADDFIAAIAAFIESKLNQ